MTEKKPEVIDVSGLPSNSFVSREKKNEKTDEKKPEKNIQKVVNGDVKKHQKTLGEKFKETFLSDEVGDVKSYLVFDVMIPALKDVVFDLVEKGVKMALFGEGTPSHVQRGRGSGNYVSYQAYSDRDRRAYRPSRRSGSYNRVSANDFSDVIFPERIDAEHVLDGLLELIDRYEAASVMDFKKFSGLPTSYTDDAAGWVNLSSAQVVRTREGYILKLPRPINLDDGPTEYNSECPF